MTDDASIHMLWQYLPFSQAEQSASPFAESAAAPRQAGISVGWRAASIALALVAIALCFFLANTRLAAAQTKVNGASVDLKTMLEKGLRVKRPEDKQFIAHVVTEVEQGNLPTSLVKSSFLWARGKRPYPFVYFQRSLKQQAKKRGIVI